MPKHWLYYLALLFPLLLRLALYNTAFIDGFWYSGNHDAYYLLAALRQNPFFAEFIGGWALPVFIITIAGYWHTRDDVDYDKHFLLLPLMYVPFTIVVNIGNHLAVDPAIFYIHPLIILPFGYLYILSWMACIWVFEKCRIVV